MYKDKWAWPRVALLMLLGEKRRWAVSTATATSTSTSTATCTSLPCFSFPCCCSGQGAWLLEFVNCDVDFAPLQRCPGKNDLFITGDSSDHVTRRVTLHGADTQCLGKGVILCQIDIELTFTLLYCTCAHAQPPAKPNLQGCSTWTQFTVTVQTHCVLQMKCGVWVGRW